MTLQLTEDGRRLFILAVAGKNIGVGSPSMEMIQYSSGQGDGTGKQFFYLL